MRDGLNIGPLTKIYGFEGRASKKKGDGDLFYSIWIDDNAAIYVKIDNNDAPSKTPGSISNLAYSAAASIQGSVEGYDIDTGRRELSRDNNVKAFIEAVVQDLLNGGTT